MFHVNYFSACYILLVLNASLPYCCINRRLLYRTIRYHLIGLSSSKINYCEVIKVNLEVAEGTILRLLFNCPFHFDRLIS